MLRALGFGIEFGFRGLGGFLYMVHRDLGLGVVSFGLIWLTGKNPEDSKRIQGKPPATKEPWVLPVGGADPSVFRVQRVLQDSELMN